MRAAPAFVVFAAVLLVAVPVRAQIVTLAGPPAGFEALAAPRLAEITLYYGGEPVGTFAAHVTPQTVRFDDVPSILTHLPVLGDPAKVGGALAGPLPVHADLICNAHRTEGCGALAPDVAGIIYDDSRQSAELFVNRRFLPVTANGGDRFLPLPGRAFSSVYNFNGAVSGGTKQDTTYAVTNDSIFSVGEAKFTTQSTIANQGLRFDEAAASVERNGWNATGGLFRSRSMTLLTNRDVGGVSFSTSSRTVRDEHRSEGNAVIVYLPRRAFVSIYREGRLYSSRAYDAGNQEIDTSELPDGAYEITLRIEEADGTAREEKRFFVKSQDLPPPGQYTYYVQAGLIRKDAANDSTLPTFTNHPIATAGIARRLTDNIGAHVAVVALQDRVATETGLTFITAHMQGSAAALVSSRGDAGVQAGMTATTGHLNASVEAQQTWFANAPLPGFGDQPKDNTQGTVTVSYAFSQKMTFGLRGSYSRQTALPAVESVGPYAEWRVWQQGEDSLVFNADAARTATGTQGDAFLRFTRRFGKYGVTASGGAILGAQGGSPSGSARVWRDSGGAPDDNLIVGAGVSADNRARTAEGDADWRNTIAQVRGSVQDSSGVAGNVATYGGNFAIGGAQLGGDVEVGGDQANQSAIIVDVAGEPGAPMTIFVNGVATGTVDAGSRQAIYLTPFHTYSVRIVPKQSILLDFDDNDRKVTLYPGNVVKLSWSVRRFVVVIGRVVTPDGRPLAGALLADDKAQVATDERGNIQAEVPEKSTLTFKTGENSSCRVTPPADVAAVNGVLVYRQPLVCAP